MTSLLLLRSLPRTSILIKSEPIYIPVNTKSGVLSKQKVQKRGSPNPLRKLILQAKENVSCNLLSPLLYLQHENIASLYLNRISTFPYNIAITSQNLPQFSITTIKLPKFPPHSIGSSFLIFCSGYKAFFLREGVGGQTGLGGIDCCESWWAAVVERGGEELAEQGDGEETERTKAKGESELPFPPELILVILVPFQPDIAFNQLRSWGTEKEKRPYNLSENPGKPVFPPTQTMLDQNIPWISDGREEIDWAIDSANPAWLRPARYVQLQWWVQLQKKNDEPIVEGLKRTSGTVNLSLLIWSNCSSSSTATTEVIGVLDTSFSLPFTESAERSIVMSSEGGGVSPVDGCRRYPSLLVEVGTKSGRT